MKTCIKALLSYALATVSGLCLVGGVTFCPGGKRYGGICKSGVHAGLRGQHQKKTPHHRRAPDQRGAAVRGLAITVMSTKDEEEDYNE